MSRWCVIAVLVVTACSACGDRVPADEYLGSWICAVPDNGVAVDVEPIDVAANPPTVLWTDTYAGRKVGTVAEGGFLLLSDGLIRVEAHTDEDGTRRMACYPTRACGCDLFIGNDGSANGRRPR